MYFLAVHCFVQLLMFLLVSKYSPKAKFFSFAMQIYSAKRENHKLNEFQQYRNHLCRTDLYFPNTVAFSSNIHIIF